MRHFLRITIRFVNDDIVFANTFDVPNDKRSAESRMPVGQRKGMYSSDQKYFQRVRPLEERYYLWSWMNIEFLWHSELLPCVKRILHFIQFHCFLAFERCHKFFHVFCLLCNWTLCLGMSQLRSRLVSQHQTNNLQNVHTVRLFAFNWTDVHDEISQPRLIQRPDYLFK